MAELEPLNNWQWSDIYNQTKQQLSHEEVWRYQNLEARLRMRKPSVPKTINPWPHVGIGQTWR